MKSWYQPTRCSTVCVNPQDTIDFGAIVQQIPLGIVSNAEGMTDCTKHRNAWRPCVAHWCHAKHRYCYQSRVVPEPCPADPVLICSGRQQSRQCHLAIVRHYAHKAYASLHRSLGRIVVFNDHRTIASQRNACTKIFGDCLPLQPPN